MRRVIVISLFCVLQAQAQLVDTGQRTAPSVSAVTGRTFYGSGAPGAVTGNLGGDHYIDTSASPHQEYTCTAASGVTCTSVSATGWVALGGLPSGTGVVVVTAGVPSALLVPGVLNSTIAFAGDSLTIGFPGCTSSPCSTNYGNVAFTLPNIVGHGNGSPIFDAAGGWTCPNLTSDYTATLHPVSPAVTGKNGYLFVMIGTNDIFVSGSSLSTVTSCLSSYYTTAKADNWIVVALTVTPTTNGNTSDQTVWRQVNDWIKSTGPENYYIDTASLMPNPTNGSYYFDSTHFQTGGYAIIAQAVNQFFGTFASVSLGTQNFVSGTGNANTECDPYSVLSSLSGSGNVACGFNVGMGGNFNTGIGGTSGNGSLFGAFYAWLGNSACTNANGGGDHDSCFGAGSNLSGGSTSYETAVGAGSQGQGSHSVTLGVLGADISYATALISKGTTFTVSGCGTAGSVTGGPEAGSFTVGTGASPCTFVITINGASGATAPNGWNCWGVDQTSSIQLIQSASSTTTCSIKGNAATSDIIRWGVLRGY